MRRALVALTACLLLLGPGAALAQACPLTSVADIEDEVMCPVCGTPLSLAIEAPQARREREFIGDLVERCKSKEEVKTALVAEFGPGVLALPRDQGFDRAAWLVPVLVLALAATGTAVATLRWRRRRPAATVAHSPGDGNGRAEGDAARQTRLQADLDRYDL